SKTNTVSRRRGAWLIAGASPLLDNITAASAGFTDRRQRRIQVRGFRRLTCGDGASKSHGRDRTCTGGRRDRNNGADKIQYRNLWRKSHLAWPALRTLSRQLTPRPRFP